MAYEIVWLKRAARELSALPRATQERIRDAVNLLGRDPRPNGVKSLRGAWEGYFRIRVGDYRIVYSVDDGARIVAIMKVGDRKEIC